jgi:hypothetical protein
VPKQLVVITGAGASFEATQQAPYEENWRPPLVTELFSNRPSFTTILGRYPDAQTLAPDLQAAVQTGAIGLETYLRENVLNAPSAYDRRRYRSIPLYLQHLLWEVSWQFTPHPVNYDRLVNAALRASDEVVFITLNYDTLLDRRLELELAEPITELEHYLNREGSWSLIKLHGSVDWMKEILTTVDGSELLLSRAMKSLGAEEELRLSPTIELRRRGAVADTRREGGILYYPALSVPLGPEDELNCPTDHRDYALSRLGAEDGLHILTVGYSGLDSGVIDLLRASGNSLRSLCVVNANGETAIEAAGRICGAFGVEVGAEMAYPQTFQDFAWAGGLEAYFERLDA